jgi:hypothetical protein
MFSADGEEVMFEVIGVVAYDEPMLNNRENKANIINNGILIYCIWKPRVLFYL